jgi:hypothetical protein
MTVPTTQGALEVPGTTPGVYWALSHRSARSHGHLNGHHGDPGWLHHPSGYSGSFGPFTPMRELSSQTGSDLAKVMQTREVGEVLVSALPPPGFFLKRRSWEVSGDRLTPTMVLSPGGLGAGA